MTREFVELCCLVLTILRTKIKDRAVIGYRNIAHCPLIGQPKT